MKRTYRRVGGYLRCPKHWPVEKRLAHYTKRDPVSGCHIWQKPPNTVGYGQLRIKYKNYTAHRLAWIDRHGPIAPGLFVCHRCDERLCINPDHLFLASHDENMADLKAKRLRRSEARMNDDGLIHIIYRGMELRGRVRVVAVDPRAQPFDDRSPVNKPASRPTTRRASGRKAVQ
jgi:hypothetical protein